MKNMVTDFKAVPNLGTDSTAAFQAALSEGAACFIPAGQYLLSGMNDACLVAELPFNWEGSGMGTTEIVIASSTPATVNGLTFRPKPGGQSNGWMMKNLSITPQTPAAGQYPIEIDLTATGAFLARMQLSGLNLVAASGADAALHLDNPTNTDGLFCSVIEKSLVTGGIKLLNAGDSLAILDNTITGPGVGVYMVSVPGAARCAILRNNITAAGGAVFLQGADQALIEGNQSEQTVAYDGPFNGMYVLSDCIDCDVISNNMNNHGNVDCVILENGTTYCRLQRNSMLTSGTYVHVAVGANSPMNFIGNDNRFYDASGRCAAITQVSPTSPLWT